MSLVERLLRMTMCLLAIRIAHMAKEDLRVLLCGPCGVSRICLCAMLKRRRHESGFSRRRGWADIGFRSSGFMGVVCSIYCMYYIVYLTLYAIYSTGLSTPWQAIAINK